MLLLRGRCGCGTRLNERVHATLIIQAWRDYALVQLQLGLRLGLGVFNVSLVDLLKDLIGSVNIGKLALQLAYV